MGYERQSGMFAHAANSHNQSNQNVGLQKDDIVAAVMAAVTTATASKKCDVEEAYEAGRKDMANLQDLHYVWMNSVRVQDYCNSAEKRATFQRFSSIQKRQLIEKWTRNGV